VNQITEIAETTGPSWITPGYDAAGNMTTAPKPSAPDLTGGYTCTYDAWNRLVQVKQGSTVVSEAKYDGLGRRIQKGLDSGSPTVASGIDLYRHFYYSDDWQLLETRSGTSGATAPQALPVE
jgi:YD repeat-containing protein